ncbi:MAG: type II toxin-antitoxin system death-on-curing family toxin [Anaerolineae bacterium]|jgi:death-on-curing protein|nr:type II toxin-antitoxin system death-on-curing family toxin [Anaerolineae bacterium]
MNSPDDDSPPVYYLTVNDLFLINETVTGELPYVRERHSLHYAVRRPTLWLFGQEQFPTIIDKAAALMDSLAHHHLFVDGNKRTALRAVTLFLEKNRWQPAWEHQAACEFVLAVAQGTQTLADIADWLHRHTRPAP